LIDTEILRLYYQYFYRKTSNEERYIFQYSERTKKVAEKFIAYLEKKYGKYTVGSHFLWTYLLFQFDYWDNLKIESFNKRVEFTYIFGEKAYTRYFDRNIEFDYKYETCELYIKYKISYYDLNKEESVVFSDPVKFLKHNTINGFNICILNTTLYRDKDEACQQCKYQNDCKILLKKNYPTIYKERGYDINK